MIGEDGEGLTDMSQTDLLVNPSAILPDLGQVAQHPFNLQILGVPAEGGRSRTETQIRFSLVLHPRVAHGYPDYRYALLNPNKYQQLGQSNDEMLAPFVTVDGWVVKSDGKPVLACLGCVMRERRKESKKKSQPLDDEMAVSELERERILVFAGSTPTPEIRQGEFSLPCRITCYCRHQDEKVGFRVALAVCDGNTGELLATALSPPIMIMDDHKRKPGQISTRTLSPLAPILPDSNAPMPSISKVIPAEGPMYGGVEVTVIGCNFTGSTTIHFGTSPASTLLFLNSCTMVVKLPPSVVSGFVPVVASARAGDLLTAQTTEVYFHYKNDLDRSMMELALQLIGMKMTGRVDDAREVAMRIIQESVTQTGESRQEDPVLFSGQDGLERTLVASLTAAEIFGGFDWTASDLAKVRTSGGQTLLHLAALRRMPGLFEYLASFEGCLQEAQDCNGFMAIELAYLQGMDTMLLGLGLEEDWMLVEGPPEPCRYQRIVQNALERAQQQRPWRRRLTKVVEWLRHPSRYRGSISRLMTSLWRRFFPAYSVKPYYFFRLTGLDAEKATPQLQSQLKAISIRTLLGTWFLSLLQLYRMSSPFGSRRLRDVMLWYAWVPILVAALLLVVIRSNLLSPLQIQN